MDSAADPTEHSQAGGPAVTELSTAIKQVRTQGIKNQALRVSPVLTQALGIHPESPTLQQQLSRALASCAARLDREIRMPFLLAAGFYEEISGSPGERVDRTAERLHLGRRTVYRRIDEAADGIAHLLLVSGRAPYLEATDFITTSTRCVVDLSLPAPSVTLTRTILALRDGVDGVDEQLYLPLLNNRPLEYRAVRGCGIVEKQNDVIGSWTIQLSFLTRLRSAESHTFTVSLTVPSHDCLEPYVGFAPVTSAQDAEIELHFADRRPRLLERLDQAWPAQITRPNRQGQPISPIAPRTVVAFENMQPGWGYGVHWVW